MEGSECFGISGVILNMLFFMQSSGFECVPVSVLERVNNFLNVST
jgi:hypothetical protein